MVGARSYKYSRGSNAAKTHFQVTNFGLLANRLHKFWPKNPVSYGHSYDLTMSHNFRWPRVKKKSTYHYPYQSVQTLVNHKILAQNFSIQPQCSMEILINSPWVIFFGDSGGRKSPPPLFVQSANRLHKIFAYNPTILCTHWIARNESHF